MLPRHLFSLAVGLAILKVVLGDETSSLRGLSRDRSLQFGTGGRERAMGRGGAGAKVSMENRPAMKTPLPAPTKSPAPSESPSEEPSSLPPTPQPTPAPSESPSEQPSSLPPTPQPTTLPPMVPNICNGLDGLCDFRVDEILWAMSHNSMAAFNNGFWLLPNHSLSLEDSLDAGFRGLNLDVCNCGGSYVLCHGVCFLGQRSVATVFGNIVSFLQQNPTESLLIVLELDSDADETVVLGEFASGLLVDVPELQDYLYVQNDITQPWPTLGTLKESGKAMQTLILFHHRGPTCREGSPCPAGFHHWFSSAMETPYDFANENELQNTVSSCRIDRGGGGTRSFFAVNAYTTPPSINEARNINDGTFLTSRLDACSSLNGNIDVNVAIVDFWHEGDVLQTVQSRNQLLIDGQ